MDQCLQRSRSATRYRRFWQSLADARRKIRRVVGSFRSLCDVAPLSEIVERDVRVDLTPFVEKLIDVAVGQQPPVQTPADAGVLRMAADRSRAVLRQRVVPLWLVGQTIHLVQVVDQKRSRLRGGRA